MTQDKQSPENPGRFMVVENIGRVSCICSDKTGTITEGQLNLTHHYPNNNFSDEQLLSIAAFASRSETDDPLDLAILHMAPTVLSHYSLVMTFPFTENRKCETAIWRKSDGVLIAATKGAPETIFAENFARLESFSGLDDDIITFPIILLS